MRGLRWLCGVAILATLGAGCTRAAPAAVRTTSATLSGSAAGTPLTSTAVSSAAPAASPALSPISPATTSIPVASSTVSAPPTVSEQAPVSAPPMVSAPPTVSAPVSRTTVPVTPSSVDLPSADLPSVDLAGVNVAGCRSAHRPVVLLHGSFSTVGSNFSALVPALRAAGRCVYGVDYGNGGIAAVTSSAGQAAALVRAVLAGTGATAVDVVAYSQGGLVLRTALRLDGLADEVRTAVLIAPSWHGTTSRAAASAPASLCPACADQVAGSALLQRLSVGGEMDGAVRYAEISSRRDTVVLPVASQVPAGPPDRVRSVVLEDVCPQVVTDHVHLPAVRGVVAWSVAALDSDGRPAPSALTC